MGSRPRLSSELLMCGLFVTLLGAMLLAMCAGSSWISPSAVLSDLGRLVMGDGSSEIDVRVQFRAPRVVLGMIVGCGLSVAGVVIQTAVRNPLADPYVLGVSSGASLGAVLLLYALPLKFYGLPLFAAAFCGGAAASLIVYVVGRARGAASSSQRLVLAGVATTYLLSALTSFVLTLVDRQGFGGSNVFVFWSLGSLARAQWDLVLIPTIVVVASLVVLMALRRRLDVLIVNDEHATALGAEPQKIRRVLFVVSAALVAACVAASGPIGFVGLMIPHATRFVVGPFHKRLLPNAALMGATFLVLADTLGRSIGGSHEVAVGIISAMCGAPCFLILLRRARWT